uniref:CASPASE_P20 domain-containing protein n=1 Tax=Anopheles gambiae TaxID=7165 RepID=A0A499FX15_ANOGA
MDDLPPEPTPNNEFYDGNIPSITQTDQIASRQRSQNARALQEEEYDTNHRRRGMAIILNHENFELMSKREGTNRDRDAATAVLTSMQFDVRVYNDLGRDELFCVLLALASEDHSDCDCLLVTS